MSKSQYSPIHYGDVAISNATINTRMQCGNSAHIHVGDGWRKKLNCIQNCG